MNIHDKTESQTFFSFKFMFSNNETKQDLQF